MKNDRPYSRKRGRRTQQNDHADAPKPGLKFSELNTRFIPLNPLTHPAELQRLQDMADRAYADHLGPLSERELRRREDLPPPGLLDQRGAAEQARWRHERALELMRRRQRELAGEGTQAWLLGVTLQQGKWLVGEEDLTRDFVKKLIKQVQRGARGLPMGSELSGVVDLSFNVDLATGLRAWAFHVHGTFLVVARTRREAIARLRKAFPYRKDPAKGVNRPRYSVDIDDDEGWEDYQDKPHRFDGIRQRRARPPTADGKAQEADKRDLTRAQRASLAGLYAQLRPDDLTVWFRHRRYGMRLVRIECHRSKSED